MITVRSYDKKDNDNFIKILIETSRLPIETAKDREYLKLLYNDYYREVEPQNCFVAADENDEAVGYIICAEDFKKYQKLFRKFYLPEIKNLGLKYYFQAVAELCGHSLYAKKYPAHLHIDILPICQGQGVGSRLMDALKDNLKQKGVTGLMLSCGADNEGAVRFYKKNGFKVISTLAGGCIMAIDI